MSTPIHLPLDSGLCRVYVTPSKIYGSLLGSELIQIYGIKRLKERDTQSVEITENSIFIPSGDLDNKSIELLKQIERLSNTKILSKREPRALKYHWNTTLSF
jgi:hypothetical protein